MYFKQVPEIKEGIERELNAGNRDFILYPFGEVGMLVKKILNECYGVQEAFIVDQRMSKHNEKIKNIDYLKSIDLASYRVLITSDNIDVYDELREQLKRVVPVENIVDLFPKKEKKIAATKVGKYSFGPLCHHDLVEEIGAFCSVARGCTVLPNHPVKYVSTHPFIYYGSESDILHKRSEYTAELQFYFPGVIPKGDVPKCRRIHIGNDVWIGQNVLITNSANIGNGAIVGAGAVVTKDVPDYAVVAGVPARIIRYRYTEEQIKALNKIAWWVWDDEKIRECYDDFFLDIDDFIKKHEA